MNLLSFLWSGLVGWGAASIALLVVAVTLLIQAVVGIVRLVRRRAPGGGTWWSVGAPLPVAVNAVAVAGMYALIWVLYFTLPETFPVKSSWIELERCTASNWFEPCRYARFRVAGDRETLVEEIETHFDAHGPWEQSRRLGHIEMVKSLRAAATEDIGLREAYDRAVAASGGIGYGDWAPEGTPAFTIVQRHRRLADSRNYNLIARIFEIDENLSIVELWDLPTYDN